MSNREDDKRVAEILEGVPNYIHAADEILVRGGIGSEKGCWICTCDYESGDIPYWEPLPFTSDPSADYKVLEWVRENLTDADGDDTLYNAWVAELSFLFSRRASIQGPTVFSVHNFLRWYREGDYSRALLEIDKKGMLK